MKAQLIGCDEKITAYMLQEFDSKKVIKVRNGIMHVHVLDLKYFYGN